ncbi:MAG: sigma-70 family RNA polymerase sigma factor [Pseudomonadota bacterium]
MALRKIWSRESMPDETDAALLQRVAAGEMAAFRRVHARFHGKVYGFAMRLLQRPDLADEVASDTMMVVWQKAANFRGEAKPETWILGITYRLSLKAMRTKARAALNDEIDEEMADDNAGPQVIEALFAAKSIAEALRHLPAEQRAIVQLTYYYGYRLVEIAEITGLPVGTVKTRMFHARAKLRKSLGDLA